MVESPSVSFSLAKTSVGCDLITPALSFAPSVPKFIWQSAAGGATFITTAQAYYSARSQGTIDNRDVLATNIGDECLSHCNGSSGFCAYCGAEGRCCPIGNDTGGFDGLLGGNDTYVCVLPITDRVSEARGIVLDEGLLLRDDLVNITEHRSFLREILARELDIHNISAADVISSAVQRPMRQATLNDSLTAADHSGHQLNLEDWPVTDEFAEAARLMMLEVGLLIRDSKANIREHDMVKGTWAGKKLVPKYDPIVEVHSGHESIMRPLMKTVEIRLGAGDSVFLVQETTDGFSYMADGGGALTFKGEFLGP